MEERKSGDIKKEKKSIDKPKDGFMKRQIDKQTDRQIGR
jgi:hypothetical protein